MSILHWEETRLKRTKKAGCKRCQEREKRGPYGKRCTGKKKMTPVDVGG